MGETPCAPRSAAAREAGHLPVEVELDAGHQGVDAGLVRAIRRQRDAPGPEEHGPLFEGWIANLLRIHNDYGGGLFDDWYYWAPGEATRTEVDFLLRRGRDWIAIEAKSTTRADADQLRGLRAIDGLAGLRRRVLA